MTAELPDVVANELKALRTEMTKLLAKVTVVETLARTITSQYSYVMGRVDDIRAIAARTDRSSIGLRGSGPGKSSGNGGRFAAQ